MTKVLIVGYGYIGQALGESLLHRGVEVCALKRSTIPVPRGINLICGDILRGIENLVPKDITHVVYCVSASEYTQEAYHAAYVQGLQNVLSLEFNDLKRFIFVSSTAVYGQSLGEEVDENSETAPTSFAGLELLEAESLISNLPISNTVLRLTGIYGPGRSRLIDNVAAGNVSCQKTPPLFTNLIHRTDCVGILEKLLFQSKIEKCYVGTDTESSPRYELLSWISDQIGAGPIHETPEGTPLPRGNKKCTSRLVQSEGYTFKYPSFREGLSDLLGKLQS